MKFFLQKEGLIAGLLIDCYHHQTIVLFIILPIIILKYIILFKFVKAQMADLGQIEEKQAEEQYYQEQIPPPPSLDRISNQLDNYYQIMGSSLRSKNYQIQNIFEKHGVIYNIYGQFMEKMKIQIIRQTLNSKIVTLRLCWGYFIMNVNILKTDRQSCIHNFPSKNSSFSSIYYFKGMVTKCTRYNRYKSKRRCRKIVLKQYFITKIASILSIGPHLINRYGFDLIISTDCIEFSIEQCVDNLEFSRQMTLSLKSDLHLLHRFNIVHFDIKPQNIMYSKKAKKVVLIDYGLSQIIKQKIGCLSYVNFKGTISYVCREMADIFYLRESRLMDVYYNDAYCLQNSARELSRMGVVQQSQQCIQYNEKVQDYEQQEQVFKSECTIKYYLYRQQLVKLEQYFERNMRTIKQHLIKNIIDYFQQLLPSNNIIKFYDKIKERPQFATQFQAIDNNIQKLIRYGHFQNSVYRHYASKFERQFLFNHSYQQQDINESQEENEMPITAESLILLLTNTTQRLDQYFLIYMRLVNLTTNYYNASLEDRVLVSNYCLANVLKRQMKEELVGLQRINYCILCILQWYGSSRHSQNIFRSSIEWITLLEYIEHLFILGRSDEQQVIQLLDALYRKYVFNVEDKLFLIIRIRSYLNWTIQRLKNKFEANRFISRVLEWCKVQYSRILINLNGKYENIIDLINFYLPLTSNKDYVSIEGNIQREQVETLSYPLNKQVLIIINLLRVQFYTQYLDECCIKNIFDIINVEQKCKIYYWIFRVYWFCRDTYNIRKLQKITKFLFDNLYPPQIREEFIFNKVHQLFHDYNSHISSMWRIQQVCKCFTLQFVYNHPETVQHLLLTYKIHRQNPQKRANHTISNQLIDILYNIWHNFTLPEAIQPEQNHLCVGYLFMSKYMQIKIYCMELLSLQIELPQLLKAIRDAYRVSKCNKCRWIIDIFYYQFYNKYLVGRYEDRLEEVQQQFIFNYRKVDQIISMKIFQRYYKTFILNNIYNLVLLCIENKKLELKYSSIRTLYNTIKSMKVMHIYYYGFQINVLIKRTMKVLFRQTIVQFVYFINHVFYVIQKNYNEHFYRKQFLKILVSFMKSIESKQNYTNILRQIENCKNTRNTHLFPIYFIILQYYLRILQSSRERIEEVKLRTILIYHRCIDYIKKAYNIYYIFIKQYKNYKNLSIRKYRFVQKLYKKFRMRNSQKHNSKAYHSHSQEQNEASKKIRFLKDKILK